MEKKKVKRIIMAIGLPGSGKTKYLKEKYPPKYIINVSELRKNLVGEDNYSQEKLVWQKVLDTAHKMMDDYGIVFIDATNVNSNYREKFLSSFPDARKIALVFYPNKKILKSDEKIEEPKIEIPDNVMKRMYSDFKNGYGKIWKQFNVVRKINFPKKKKMDESLSESMSYEQMQTVSKKIKKYFGKELGEYIGSGAFGFAFPFNYNGKNLILKITEDKSEVNNSSKIARKNIPNVVKIYDIYKVSLSGEWEKTWIILEQRVKPISDDSESGWYKLIYSTYRLRLDDIDNFSSFISKLNINEIKEQLTYMKEHSELDDIVRLSTIYLDAINSNEELFSYFVTLIMRKAWAISKYDASLFKEQFKQLFSNTYDLEFMDNIKNVKDVITVGKYCKDILSAISNLNKFNITVPDTHVLNIGRDDNYNFYLFDLGASSVKHTPRTRKVISENIEKKLIIFDFDGTLVNTDAKIYIIHSDGEKIGISPEEFNDYVPREGDTFDYYDFADIDYLINPQEIKSAMKIFMAIEKVKEPNKKIAILTARRNSKPVVNYLNRKGFKNYTVVSVGGDISTDVANKKKIWIERQIKNGYNTVVYFDDSAENIKAVKELKNKYPDVKFELKHVVEWKKR